LVELMVALTLALLVTGAVISVFVGTRSAFQSTSGTAGLTDGGRFALDFLQQSVRSAGFMACNTTQRQASILNVPAQSLAYNFIEPLGGFEANNTGVGGAFTVTAPLTPTSAPVVADPSTGDWVGGLDPALAGLVVQNNDVLVVRSTQPAPNTPLNNQTAYVMTIAAGSSTFTVSNAAAFAGATTPLAVISDCASSVAFQIASVTGTMITLAGSGATPGNTAAAFPVNFNPGAEVTPITTVVWFIGPGADGDSALFSYALNSSGVFPASPSETVPDIEAMQILYGVDTTGTQTVAEYVTADQVTDFSAVMSVKIAVLAASAPFSVRAPTIAPQFNLLGTIVTAPLDTRSRQVFEITIGVRNSLS
jgi:type IV pilus assembly protein PilW